MGKPCKELEFGDRLLKVVVVVVFATNSEEETVCLYLKIEIFTPMSRASVRATSMRKRSK